MHRTLVLEDDSKEGHSLAGGNRDCGLAGGVADSCGNPLKPGDGSCISEACNHRVCLFGDSFTGGVVVGGGKKGNSLVGVSYVLGGFAVQSSGRLRIADEKNHRVHVFKNESTEDSVLTAKKNGNGFVDELYHPTSIAIKPGGRLYVADEENQRVFFFEDGSTEGHVVASGKKERVKGELPTSPVTYMSGIALKACDRDLPIFAQRQVIENTVSRCGHARGFLRSVSMLWGSSQMEGLLECVDNDKPAEKNSRFMPTSYSREATATRYGGLAIAKDSMAPSVDYALDNFSLVTCVIWQQYDFAALVTTGILMSNLFVSSYAMMDKKYGEGRYGTVSMVCHVLSRPRSCRREGKEVKVGASY